MSDPREAAEAAESGKVPAGPYGERFGGYGVMGLPFASGHVLALRRFPASSLAEPYTSVWHRDPSGRWSMYQDVPAEQACPRYFDAAVDRTIPAEIDLAWTGPNTMQVTAEGLQWRVSMTTTGMTRTMNAIAGRMPAGAWSSPTVLRMMGRVAGAAMKVGRVGLQGTSPNGQRFQAHPLRVWMASDSTATIDGQDLGPPGPLAEQARLGDFWIPQRGVFAIGRSFFEDFDPTRHTAVRAPS